VGEEWFLTSNLHHSFTICYLCTTVITHIKFEEHHFERLHNRPILKLLNLTQKKTANKDLYLSDTTPSLYLLSLQAGSSVNHSFGNIYPPEHL